jgi:hypothetical protein
MTNTSTILGAMGCIFLSALLAFAALEPVSTVSHVQIAQADAPAAVRA